MTAPVTAKRLEELGELLIHVYGQNESQQLLSKEAYVSIVDRFLGLEKESGSFGEGQAPRTGESRPRAGKKDAEERAREMDLLTYQIEEIERENIEEGEEERIRERLKVLRDAARIKGSLEASRGLYEDEQSAYARLGRLRAASEAFFRHRVDGGPQEKIDALTFDVEDIVESIREHRKSLDYEPGELEEMEERLSDDRQAQR